MATFTGSLDEFRRYIGPYLRNLVQRMTKKHKTKCEHCGVNSGLESAHVEGRDRNQIIDSIWWALAKSDPGCIDLSAFEKAFIKAHFPLNKSILILCRACHRKYDAKQLNTSGIQNSGTTGFGIGGTLPRNLGVVLPIELFPAGVAVFKDALLQSTKAEILVIFSDGTSQTKVWDARKIDESSNVIGNLRSRPEFRSGQWQNSGIQSIEVHVLP